MAYQVSLHFLASPYTDSYRIISLNLYANDAGSSRTVEKTIVQSQAPRHRLVAHFALSGRPVYLHSRTKGWSDRKEQSSEVEAACLEPNSVSTTCPGPISQDLRILQHITDKSDDLKDVSLSSKKYPTSPWLALTLWGLCCVLSVFIRVSKHMICPVEAEICWVV